MAEPTSPSTPPVTRTICPKCGLPMFLVRVELTDKAGHDQRIFECPGCDYSQQVNLKSR